MKRTPVSLILLALLVPAASSGQTNSGATGLISVYEQAVNYDSELSAARSRKRAREAGINEARAALLPRLSLFGRWNFTSRIDVDETLEDKQYGAELNQPLFDATAWFNFQASQELDEQQKAELSLAQQQLMLDVAVQYFEVLRARDELDTARAQEQALRRQWEQARERYNVGLVATTEVEEARAGYDASQSERISAQSQLDIERESLFRITGQYYDNLERLATNFPIVKPEPNDPDAWKEQALRQNWSIQAARHAVDAAREELSASRSGHLPTLDLTAAFQRSESDIPTGDFAPQGGATFTSEQTERRIGLSLEIPLYEGGGTAAEVRRERSELETTKSELDTTRRDVRLDTRSLFRQIRTSMETVRAQRQTIVSRRSALDATRAGYDVGTRNIVEVLDAEQNYFVALRDFANARYDYVLNTLRLKQASGTLSPADLRDLDRWLSASAPGIERLAREVTRKAEKQEPTERKQDKPERRPVPSDAVIPLRDR